MKPDDLRPIAALALLGAASAALACTEDPITGPPGEGIDEPSETVEVSLTAEEFALWRDTTYSGFAVPTDAAFMLVAEEDDFTARTLLRYGSVPDSVEVDSVRVAIEEYRDAEIRLVLDTAASTIPDDNFALRLMGLARSYDHEEVTWEEASAGEPWSTPGGDLTRELGSLDLTQPSDSFLPDTLVVPIEGVTDSLLADWAARDGGLGAALLVDGPGARLRLRGATLRFDVLPAGRDSALNVNLFPFLDTSPITFMYDPPQPAVGSALRLGGLPANRVYLEFLPPDTVEGVALRGGTINRAELVFRPLPAPVSPFAMRISATAAAIDLAGDPFETGPKTPIGPTLGGGVRTLEPDSLAAGAPLRFDITSLMTSWAAAPDSFGTFTVGVRLQPDAQTVGFWEMGSVTSEPALQPFVRVVLTPPTDFDVP